MSGNREKVLLGIDVLRDAPGIDLKGKRLGLLSNQASMDGELRYTKDVVHELYGSALSALFSPQHGFFGVEQDNMKESGHSVDRALNIPLYSLYSDVREPSDEMFSGIDALLVDLFDVGTRVYTFIHTMALCMKKARETGKAVIVLDRPNPISDIVEGNLLKSGFASFVGMYPIPIRHGMTIGELAMLFNDEYGIGCDLKVVKMSGYERRSYYDETGLKFPFPSPNMPTLDTAIVYPGQVIFEGTNISEGRGTTKPFEIFGAPFIDPDELKGALTKHAIRGVTFRDIYFKPTFNKYMDETCGGLILNVTDRAEYEPYITSLIILKELFDLYGDEVKFLEPPYEYEYEKLPFDIITGDDRIREALVSGDGLNAIRSIMKEGEDAFKAVGKKYHLY
jgi:uncharacterized protein YbbC (DUF1343 family)